MKLKEIREKKNMTQEDLANAVGVTQGAISQWENGFSKPGFDNIKKLAAALECTLDELIAGTESE